jgi:hypothetical protein
MSLPGFSTVPEPGSERRVRSDYPANLTDAGKPHRTDRQSDDREQTAEKQVVDLLTLLVLIGAELILQGFGLDFEPVFNAIMVVAIIVAIIYQRRQTKLVVSSGA